MIISYSEEIENVLKNDDRNKYKSYKNYHEQIKTDFRALLIHKFFIENRNLTTYWWDGYIRTKCYLKECALSDSNIPSDLREVAFYDWLKICINPQNDSNIDFYFNDKGLVKEDEVKKILFDKGDKLKDIFVEKKDWQIRLKKIRTWFLKRYDWRTSIKLYLSSKDKRRNWPEFIDLLFPRLFCSILIGFVILFSNSETWKLPLNLNFLEIILAAILILVYVYFIYECFDAVGGEKDTISITKRVLPIFGLGLGYSLLFSSIFYGIHSCYFTDSGWVTCNEDFSSSSKIIAFFAVVALSIGIFIQIIWEEKTVTEPL